MEVEEGIRGINDNGKKYNKKFMQEIPLETHIFISPP